MKRYLSVILIMLILLISISCNKNNKEITEPVIEKHPISYRNTSYNALSVDMLDATIIPFYYHDRYLETFNNYDDFDSFMNKIDKNNKYAFFIPLIGNSNLFNKITFQFQFISDYDTIYTNCLKIEDKYDESRKTVFTTYKTLEEADYKLVTDYNKIDVKFYYDKDTDESHKYKYSFTLDFYTRSGSLIIDYFDKIYRHSNKKYDIYNTNEFIYSEQRIFSSKANNQLARVGSKIYLFDNDLYNAYFVINVDVDRDIFDDINLSGEIDEEKLNVLKEDLNYIYDSIYEEIIKYGYKIYDNE